MHDGHVETVCPTIPVGVHCVAIRGRCVRASLVAFRFLDCFFETHRGDASLFLEEGESGVVLADDLLVLVF